MPTACQKAMWTASTNRPALMPSYIARQCDSLNSAAQRKPSGAGSRDCIPSANEKRAVFSISTLTTLTSQIRYSNHLHYMSGQGGLCTEITLQRNAIPPLHPSRVQEQTVDRSGCGTHATMNVAILYLLIPVRVQLV
jgi:hypothetical protein